jgi:hypothetical protein
MHKKLELNTKSHKLRLDAAAIVNQTLLNSDGPPRCRPDSWELFPDPGASIQGRMNNKDGSPVHPPRLVFGTDSLHILRWTNEASPNAISALAIAAVVLPDGSLFGEGVKRTLPRQLRKGCHDATSPPA